MAHFATPDSTPLVDSGPSEKPLTLAEATDSLGMAKETADPNAARRVRTDIEPGAKLHRARPTTTHVSVGALLARIDGGTRASRQLPRAEPSDGDAFAAAVTRSLGVDGLEALPPLDMRQFVGSKDPWLSQLVEPSGVLEDNAPDLNSSRTGTTESYLLVAPVQFSANSAQFVAQWVVVVASDGTVASSWK
eukprot:gene3692-93_t